MASKTDIANRALTKLGDDRIIDLLDDTERARTINSLYNSCRDAELRAHVWNFAVQRVSLPRLASVPAFGFKFEYQLPSDSLRIIQVAEEWYWWGGQDWVTGPMSQFQIEGRKLLTDYDAPLDIRYISRVDDTGLYDSLFVEAFACRLALEACERITQSNTKLQSIQQQYQETMRMALRVDAVENPPQQLPDESWMISRL
jgi:hypothetical protein